MQLDKFKTLLQQERFDIMNYISNHPTEIDFDGDDTDVIQAKILARSAAEILAKKQDKLRKIEFAMKKIETGNYGDCEECEEPIALKRLMIDPGFNTCISCAEYNEILRKKNSK